LVLFKDKSYSLSFLAKDISTPSNIVPPSLVLVRGEINGQFFMVIQGDNKHTLQDEEKTGHTHHSIMVVSNTPCDDG